MLTREQVGKNIRNQRRAAGMTQEDLGAALGLERTAISRIEQGRQGTDTLQLAGIAQALRCSPLVFFDAADSWTAELVLRIPELEAAALREHMQYIDDFIRDHMFLRGNDQDSNQGALMPDAMRWKDR